MTRDFKSTLPASLPCKRIKRVADQTPLAFLLDKVSRPDVIPASDKMSAREREGDSRKPGLNDRISHHPIVSIVPGT